MLIRSPGSTYLARNLLIFWIIFAGMMIAKVCYAGYAGSLVNYDFPSEINLVPGEPVEIELTVTVKNTGDQTWRAYNVQDPFNATPSWRWRAKNPSWKPCGPNCTVYTFGVSHFVDVYPGEIKTSTMSPRSADLPDQVGEYFFTLECHYTEKDYPWIYYRPMDNSPVVIRFKVVSIGAISGQITDSEGDPIPGLEVLAQSDISRSELLGKAITDGKGNYTIDRVRAGTACVSIERGGAIVWYDGQEGTEDPKEAIVLEVRAGQTISKINIGAQKIRAMPWLPLLLDE